MINAPSSYDCLKALMQANFSVLLKNRRSLIISFLLPVFLLIVWDTKQTLNAYGGPTFVLAIVVTIGLLPLSLFGYTLAVARDREQGVFQRLRVTPTPTWTIMISRILIQEVANLVVAVLVLLVGSRVYNVSLQPTVYLLVVLVALLGGAVFLSIGQAIVGLIRSSDSVNATSRLVYILLMLVGLLGLTGTLGGTVEAIARWSPLGVVIRVFEGLPQIGFWTLSTSAALVACIGYVLVFGFIGIQWFTWESN